MWCNQVYFAREGSPCGVSMAGRRLKLRSDWEQVKIEVMQAVIRAKFAPGRPEAHLLLSTGNAKLVEGTLWHDDFWGVDLEEPGRPGANRLGELLEGQRILLKEGVSPVPRFPKYGWL